MASRLVRASERQATRIKRVADTQHRTFIAQHDLIIDAGIKALGLEPIADEHEHDGRVPQPA